MIVIYQCPHCVRENEFTTTLEENMDYIEEGEPNELITDCQECGYEVTLHLTLESEK